MYFLERLLLVRDEAEGAVGDDAIDGGVGQRQPLGVAAHETDVHAAIRRSPCGVRHFAGGDVDAGDRAGGAGGGGGDERVHAKAGADVQHGIA